MRGSWGDCWLLCWRVATAALPNSPFLTFNSSRSSLSCELNEMMVNDIDSRPDSLGSRVNNQYAHRHRRGFAVQHPNRDNALRCAASMLLRSAVRRRSETGMDRRFPGMVRRRLGWPALHY